MDIATDDNFFIDEPQKLRNNFFSKDKSLQMVELLAAQKHNLDHTNANNKRPHLNRIQTCRLTYSKKLQHIHNQLQQHPQHQHPQLSSPTATSNAYHNSLPRSFITELEEICKATCNTDDISVAESAVDLLVSASKSGCCFLEKYIVMLLKFCTKKHPPSDAMRIKVDELLDRVLIVDFDRQQLIESLRRPEYKLTSAEHVIQLLRKIQAKFNQNEKAAVDWLFVILDAYFVELATKDEAADILDQLSAHINFQCALLRETENTKCLLRSIVATATIENHTSNNINSVGSRTMVKLLRNKRPHYCIEHIEF